MSTATASKPAPGKPATKAIPDGMHTVTPHLVIDGAAKAIDFYKAAFNAIETARLAGPDGKIMHGGVKIGDSVIMLVDENADYGMFGPLALKGTPVTLHLSVEDVDAFVAQAVSAGAKVVMPVADMFWGDRYGVLADPFGHSWSVATHIRDLTPEEIQEAAKGACCGS